MTVRLNQKGKYFTEVVKKNPIRAVIETSSGRIEGTIHLQPKHRLLDDLDHGSGFLAVTDVIFFPAEETAPVDFIALNIEHIIWIQPLEESTRQTHDDN
jgi:hypothetical protein